MGMFREGGNEIDIIKEMAEGLGSQGLKLEDLIEKIQLAKQRVDESIEEFHRVQARSTETIEAINKVIRDHNVLVDAAEDALRWLLIQREACGFRTHKNVNVFYPIPEKLPLLRRDT